jgi:hypothetical protein
LASNAAGFVETNFDEEKTPENIRRVFLDVQDVSSKPMNLRSIFLAMARKGAEV